MTRTDVKARSFVIDTPTPLTPPAPFIRLPRSALNIFISDGGRGPITSSRQSSPISPTDLRRRDALSSRAAGSFWSVCSAALPAERSLLTFQTQVPGHKKTQKPALAIAAQRSVSFHPMGSFQRSLGPSPRAAERVGRAAFARKLLSGLENRSYPTVRKHAGPEEKTWTVFSLCQQDNQRQHQHNIPAFNGLITVLTEAKC